MEYQAIIFDMDGTIIESDYVWFTASKAVIEKRNITLTSALIEQLKPQLDGASLVQACKVIKEMFNLPEPLEDIINEKKEHAYSLFDQKLVYIDGFISFHQKITQLQIKSAIATNGTLDMVQYTCEKLKLGQFFGSHVYTINHVSNGKPAPDVYLYAANQLNIDPKNCIAIEDSAHGIRAAKAAGMFCIGINHSHKLDTNSDADLLVSSYQEIDIPRLFKTKITNP